MSAVILAQLAAPGAAAGSRHSHSQRAPGRRQRARHAPIANATAAAVPPLLESVQQAAASHAALYTLETLLAATAAYAAAVWPDRPRGWCFRELLTVRPSPVAGNGVFALVDIQAGTVLGAYPGRPRTPQQMAAKVASAPSAAGYCFRCGELPCAVPSSAVNSCRCAARADLLPAPGAGRGLDGCWTRPTQQASCHPLLPLGCPGFPSTSCWPT